MRLSLLRVFPLLLTALIAGVGLAAPAHAGEEDARARERGARERRVVAGLQAGIKSLRAVGGQERVILHLQELIAELRGPAWKQASKGGEAEERRIKQMVGVMHMARKALLGAGREEQAEVLKHGLLALKMLWSGRSDEEAMAVLVTAPSQEAQANALLQAAEILGDGDRKRQAKACAALGRKFGGKSRAPKQGQKRKRRAVRRRVPANPRTPRPAAAGGEQVRARPVHPEQGLDGLRQRLTILRLAMVALREGEQREAGEMLERALHTAELLLEERQDEEAQRIYRNTPNLIQLSKLLHLSARLWLKFEQPDKAERVARLSRYYRLRAMQKEEADDEAEEEDKGARGKEEARQARADTWAVRQQKEMEARQRRARDEALRHDRRREHEQRVRTHARRGRAAEREARGRRSSADDETTQRIDELRGELQEVQRALQQLMRELSEIVRDR